MDKISFDAYIDGIFAGRTFEVYSIVTGEALSTPASFNVTCDELDMRYYTSGASNGLDMREVK